MNEQKRRIFEDTITKAYDHEKFKRFLRELLVNIQPVAPDKEVKPWSTFSAAVDHYNHIGNYVGDDNNKVALFSVCLINDKNLENARSMQRSFVKSLLENSDCAGALVSFYTLDAKDKWRLSLVRLDYEFSKGKISEKLTPAKRYSYLVGEDEPHHTAQERLFPIFTSDDHNPSLDELEEAFSVEAVTKEFFDQYRSKYLDLKEFLDSNPKFKAEADSRGFTSEQFAKKLMGQIVFLYFIQKKGWLGVNAFPYRLTEREYKSAFFRSGQKPKELMPYVYRQAQDGFFYRNRTAFMSLSIEDETFLSTLVKGDPWGSGYKDFMRRIFDGCMSAGKNYFDDFLEPLFYTGLNQNRGDNAFFPALHRRIPFLNGGLFEEMEGYDWRNNDFRIPNEIFSNIVQKGKRDADGILDVFDRFNFTMAEDEPMEREVAIDPEMLGKVFENLLDVTDRKSKGAFYTPREIVHYMCQESLINYLSVKTEIVDEDIRKFILYGEYFRDEDTKKTIFIKGENGGKGHMEFDYKKSMEIPESIFSYKRQINRLREIDNLLANVKVVDPAVGSGAFPLGMLTEIVKARETITSYMTIDMNGYQRLSYRSMRNPYRLKRETIKNSIFACDIEASATDITKLRLWLSLVIDNQIMSEQNEELGYSTKPRELPNLECNIICGNSLVDEFQGIPLITQSAVLGNDQNMQLSTFDESIGIKITQLIELQSKLYDEKDHIAKDSLKNRIQDIYNEIVMEQLKRNTKAVDEYYHAIQQPSKPFVLWQLYFPRVFKEKGGFDIVIGNPPYVRVQNLSHDIIDFYKRRYATAWKRIDISTLFIELGESITNSQGHISFISSNQFLTTEYGRKMREFLIKTKLLYKIVDFGDLPVFQNALTYVSIFFMNNAVHSTIEYHRVKNLPFYSPADFDVINVSNLTDEVWTLGSDLKTEIMAKINNRTTEKLNMYAKCWAGVITGKDEILMWDIDKYVDCIDNSLIMPVIRAQGCDRYCYATPSKKIYYPYKEDNSDTVLLSLNELQEEYPLTYQYVMSNEEKLKSRKDSRKTFADKKGWYGLVRFGRLSRFQKKKIVSPGEVKHNKFALDETGSAFSCARVFSITAESNEVNIYYLLAFLNSKIAEFYMHNTTSLKAGGYYSYSSSKIDALPLVVKGIDQTYFIEIVKKILKRKKDDRTADTQELEKLIDDKFYEIYGLDSAEIISLETELKDRDNEK